MGKQVLTELARLPSSSLQMAWSHWHLSLYLSVCCFLLNTNIGKIWNWPLYSFFYLFFLKANFSWSSCLFLWFFAVFWRMADKRWFFFVFPVFISKHFFKVNTVKTLYISCLLVIYFNFLFVFICASPVIGKPLFAPRRFCPWFEKPSSASSQLGGSAHWITTRLLQHSITSNSSLEHSSWFDEFLLK